MDLSKVIKKRRSIRKFKRKSVSWRDLMEVVDATLNNPFAGNINNLKFLIIERKDTIKTIAQHANQTWIANAPALIVIGADDRYLENHYGERGRVYSKQQAGAVVQTILLKCTDLGLASCWIGAYTDELLKEKLKIPQHIQVEGIVAIGYEDKKEQTPEKKKKELENTLYWEKWKTTKRTTIFGEGQEPNMPQEF